MCNYQQEPAVRVSNVLSVLLFKGLNDEFAYHPEAKILLHNEMKKLIDLGFDGVRGSNYIFDILALLNATKTTCDFYLDYVSQGAKILTWDGSNIEELKADLDQLIELTALEGSDDNNYIESRLLIALGGHARLPHDKQIPEDFRNCRGIIACDRRGYCLLGVDKIEHVDELRRRRSPARGVLPLNSR